MGNFNGAYIDYREKRIKVIKNYYGEDWFRNKKILELGCGHADISYVFYKLGAISTVSDAREEHLEVVKKKFPFFKVIRCDLDKEWNFDEQYDLIIHMGVLYHLKNYEQNLINCFRNCDNMFLETIVTDSDDENYVEFANELGFDQAYNGIGCRPSVRNIEKIITENNHSFIEFNKNLSSGSVSFNDWEIENTKKCYISTEHQPWVWLRKAWFVKNNNK